MIVADCSTITKKVEVRTAARNAGAGSGVERIRLRIPDSRRTTSVIPSPAKHVAASAVADHPGLQERRGLDVVLLLDVVVPVDGAEDHEQDHR